MPVPPRSPPVEAPPAPAGPPRRDEKLTAPAMQAVRPSIRQEAEGARNSDPDELEERPTMSSPPIQTPLARRPERDRAVLLRLDGAVDEQVVLLPSEPVKVGRGREAAIRIDDDEVSRLHAEIRPEGGGHVVIDLDSRNGTWVQGERTARVALVDGDLVQFGPRATFRYTLMDEKQEQILKRLYESSTRDPLTGAYNRRHFDDRLRAEIAYALRHGTELSLLLFDLDHFKAVNDAHGHPAGDAVLAFVAAVVTCRLRTEDVFARYGGEEFVVLLRGTDLAGGSRASERIRSAIAGAPLVHDRKLIPVTVSVGCTSFRACGQPTAEAFIAAVDRLLYAAKEAGRNRVVAG